MRIGAHESVAGGLHRAFDAADEDAAEAVQIFTKNANTWREPELTAEAVQAFRDRAGNAPRRRVLSHDSYLINLATDDDAGLARSRASLLAEVQRCVALGVDYVVLHPGSCGAPARGESDADFALRVDAGLTRIAESLSYVHGKVGSDVPTRIVLENTAGQGGCLGCSFEQIGTIIARTAVGGDRLGVCFDTQHAFASGYDLRTRDGYDAAWAEFDRHIGLARLAAFHLNDSKKPFASRVDRHENIGRGLLGLEPFRLLVNDPRFADTPAVLETPFEDNGEVRPYGREIALLRGLAGRTEPIAPPAEPLLAPPPPLALTASTPASATKKKAGRKPAAARAARSE
jgi:deoxyribonuclease-4